MTAHYRRHYLAREDDIPLFAGADRLLAELDAAGYLLAVATGQVARGPECACSRRTRSPTRFHATRCADEGLPKPHPDMLLHLMERLDVAPRADADDRRHDARPRSRAQCGRRGRGGRVRRARVRGTRAAARRSRPCIRSRSCRRGSRRTGERRSDLCDRRPSLRVTTLKNERSVAACGRRLPSGKLRGPSPRFQPRIQSNVTSPIAMPRAIASGRFIAPSLVLMFEKWKLTVRSATHELGADVGAGHAPRGELEAVALAQRQGRGDRRPHPDRVRRATSGRTRAARSRSRVRSPTLASVASRRAALTGLSCRSNVTVTWFSAPSVSATATPLHTPNRAASDRKTRRRMSSAHSPASHSLGPMCRACPREARVHARERARGGTARTSARGSVVHMHLGREHAADGARDEVRQAVEAVPAQQRADRGFRRARGGARLSIECASASGRTMASAGHRAATRARGWKCRLRRGCADLAERIIAATLRAGTPQLSTSSICSAQLADGRLRLPLACAVARVMTSNDRRRRASAHGSMGSRRDARTNASSLGRRLAPVAFPSRRRPARCRARRTSPCFISSA